MAGTIDRFHQMLLTMGSDITYHREGGGEDCPCRTPEGFRDPAWHVQNPEEPVCNEQGLLNVVVTEFTFKGAIQGAHTRYFRQAMRVDELLGSVERGDKIGIFPCTWVGNTLDMEGWSDAGEDYLAYDGHRYLVVAADKMPDVDGTTAHHWECGLRLIKDERPL